MPAPEQTRRTARGVLLGDRPACLVCPRCRSRLRRLASTVSSAQRLQVPLAWFQWFLLKLFTVLPSTRARRRRGRIADRRTLPHEPPTRASDPAKWNRSGRAWLHQNALQSPASVLPRTFRSCRARRGPRSTPRTTKTTESPFVPFALVARSKSRHGLAASASLLHRSAASTVSHHGPATAAASHPGLTTFRHGPIGLQRGLLSFTLLSWRTSWAL